MTPNQPTPPLGYRLLKPEEYDKPIPEGAIFFQYRCQMWQESNQIGDKPEQSYVYAVPETTTSQEVKPCAESVTDQSMDHAQTKTARSTEQASDCATSNAALAESNPPEQRQPVDIARLRELLAAAKNAGWCEIVESTTRLYHALRNEAPALLDELESLRAEPRADECMMIRCITHRSIRQQNHNKISGGECGAYIAAERDSLRREVAELRARLKE